MESITNATKTTNNVPREDVELCGKSTTSTDKTNSTVVQAKQREEPPERSSSRETKEVLENNHDTNDGNTMRKDDKMVEASQDGSEPSCGASSMLANEKREVVHESKENDKATKAFPVENDDKGLNKDVKTSDLSQTGTSQEQNSRSTVVSSNNLSGINAHGQSNTRDQSESKVASGTAAVRSCESGGGNDKATIDPPPKRPLQPSHEQTCPAEKSDTNTTTASGGTGQQHIQKRPIQQTTLPTSSGPVPPQKQPLHTVTTSLNKNLERGNHTDSMPKSSLTSSGALLSSTATQNISKGNVESRVDPAPVPTDAQSATQADENDAMVDARRALTSLYDPYLSSFDTCLADARTRLKTALQQTLQLRESFTERVYTKYRICLRHPPTLEQTLDAIARDPAGYHRRISEEINDIKEEKELEKKQATRLNGEMNSTTPSSSAQHSESAAVFHWLQSVDNAEQLMYLSAGLNLVILPEEELGANEEQRLRGYTERGPVNLETGQRAKGISQAAATAGEVMLDRTRKARALRLERRRKRQLQLLSGEDSAAPGAALKASSEQLRAAQDSAPPITTTSSAGSARPQQDTFELLSSEVSTPAEPKVEPNSKQVSPADLGRKQVSTGSSKGQHSSGGRGRPRLQPPISVQNLRGLLLSLDPNVAEELNLVSKSCPTDEVQKSPSAATLALLSRGVGSSLAGTAANSPNKTAAAQVRLRHPHPESLGGKRRASLSPSTGMKRDASEQFFSPAHLALTLPPLPSTRERVERKPLNVLEGDEAATVRAQQSVHSVFELFKPSGDNKTGNSLHSKLGVLHGLWKLRNERLKETKATTASASDSESASKGKHSVDPVVTFSVLQAIGLIASNQTTETGETNEASRDCHGTTSSSFSVNEGNAAFFSPKLNALSERIESERQKGMSKIFKKQTKKRETDIGSNINWENTDEPLPKRTRVSIHPVSMSNPGNGKLPETSAQAPVESLRGGGEVLHDPSDSKGSSEQHNIDLSGGQHGKGSGHDRQHHANPSNAVGHVDEVAARSGSDSLHAPQPPYDTSATAIQMNPDAAAAAQQIAYLNSHLATSSAAPPMAHLSAYASQPDRFSHASTLNALHLANQLRHLHPSNELADYLGGHHPHHHQGYDISSLLSGAQASRTATHSSFAALGLARHGTATGLIGYSLQDRAAAARAMLVREHQHVAAAAALQNNAFSPAAAAAAAAYSTQMRAAHSAAAVSALLGPQTPSSSMMGSHAQFQVGTPVGGQQPTAIVGTQQQQQATHSVNAGVQQVSSVTDGSRKAPTANCNAASSKQPPSSNGIGLGSKHASSSTSGPTSSLAASSKQASATPSLPPINRKQAPTTASFASAKQAPLTTIMKPISKAPASKQALVTSGGQQPSAAPGDRQSSKPTSTTGGIKQESRPPSSASQTTVGSGKASGSETSSSSAINRYSSVPSHPGSETLPASSKNGKVAKPPTPPLPTPTSDLNDAVKKAPVSAAPSESKPVCDVSTEATQKSAQGEAHDANVPSKPNNRLTASMQIVASQPVNPSVASENETNALHPSPQETRTIISDDSKKTQSVETVKTNEECQRVEKVGESVKHTPRPSSVPHDKPTNVQRVVSTSANQGTSSTGLTNHGAINIPGSSTAANNLVTKRNREEGAGMSYQPPAKNPGLSDGDGKSILEGNFFHVAWRTSDVAHMTAGLDYLLAVSSSIPIPKTLVQSPLREKLNTPGFKNVGTFGTSVVLRETIVATILVWLWATHRIVFHKAFDKNGRLDVDHDCKWLIQAAVDTAVQELSLDIAESIARGEGAFADASATRKGNLANKHASPKPLDPIRSSVSKKVEHRTAVVVSKALSAKVMIDMDMEMTLPLYHTQSEFLDEARIGALRAKTLERVVLANLLASKVTMTESFSLAYVSAMVRAGEALGHDKLVECIQLSDLQVSTMLPYDILADGSGVWQDPCRPDNGFTQGLTGDELMRRAHARAMIQKALRKLQDRHNIRGGSPSTGPYVDPGDLKASSTAASSTDLKGRNPAAPTVGRPSYKRKYSAIAEPPIPPGTGSAAAKSWTVYDPRHFCEPLPWDSASLENAPYGRHRKVDRPRAISLSASSRSGEPRNVKKAKRTHTLSTTTGDFAGKLGLEGKMPKSTNEIEWASVADVFQRVALPRKTAYATKSNAPLSGSIAAPFCKKVEGELESDDESDTEEVLTEEATLERHQVVLDDMKAKMNAYMQVRKKQQDRKKTKNSKK